LAEIERIWHPPQPNPPIHHPAVHIPAVHHPAVTHVEVVPAVYQHHEAVVVSHPAVVVNHPAVVVRHEAVVVHHPAVTHVEYDENGEPYVVEDSPAWDEEISPAWDEEIAPAWDEVVNPAWDEVVTPAWDELISPAMEITVIDVPERWDPEVNIPEWWEPVPDTQGYWEEIEVVWTPFTVVSDSPLSEWTPEPDTVATGVHFNQTRMVSRHHANWESSPGRPDRLASTETVEMEVVQAMIGTGIWSAFDEIIGTQVVSDWSPAASTVPVNQSFTQGRSVRQTHRRGERHTNGTERNVVTEQDAEPSRLLKNSPFQHSAPLIS
jgi:hypothetical protein